MSDEFPISPDTVSPPSPPCSYCGLPVPGAEDDETDAQDDAETEQDRYCSTACETAAADTDEALPAFDETAFITTGVSAIDTSLPQGTPRDSFIVLSGEPGTRGKTVLVELAWRRLEAGEPVILIAASDPPLMVLEQFLTLKWNIIPHLEAGRLHIIDCYGHQQEEDVEPYGDEWTKHLRTVATPHIHRVHEPGQPHQVTRRIRTAANDLGLSGMGAIVIDSLTELGTLMRDVNAYAFIKTLRADYCKARDITVFAGANFTGSADEYPHAMEFLFDGIIDLTFNPQAVPGILLKELTVRKMRGVMAIREAKAFEIMEHAGMMLVQPSDSEPVEEHDEAATAPNPEDVPPTRTSRKQEATNTPVSNTPADVPLDEPHPDAAPENTEVSE